MCGPVSRSCRASEVNLRRAVSDSLVERGFHRSGRTVVQRLGDEWSFWVDTGPLGKSADITPFVGIRNDRVEELFACLLGVPHDKYVGTVGANVGYLIDGQVITWVEPTPADEVVRAIERALERLRPYLSLDRLPQAWELKGASDPGKLYRLVVIALLRGDRESAMQALENARKVFCKVENAVCDQFRDFEARALQYLSGQLPAK